MLRFPGDRDNLRAKIQFYLQSMEITFRKIRKIKQNWTRPETFDICFYVRFHSYCQKFIFRGDAGH